MKTNLGQKIYKIALLIIILLLVALLSPLQKMNWGKLELLPASTITVSGEAHLQETSQIATFTAGVTAYNDDKDTAVNEVNENIDSIIKSVKEFGIDGDDIQTQNASVNQRVDAVFEDNTRSVKTGQWQANNTIQITLRDVEKASALTDLLNQSEATTVYGPRFSLDETQDAEVLLLEQAIENAREKAEKIAKSSKRKLGKVITVSEGSQSPAGIYRSLPEAGGGDTSISAPIEPGTETVYKNVTVTFELR